MQETQGRLVLEVTVVLAGTSAPWQAEVKVRGRPDTLTFNSPQAVAQYLSQVAEQPISSQGLR